MATNITSFPQFANFPEEINIMIFRHAFGPRKKMICPGLFFRSIDRVRLFRAPRYESAFKAFMLIAHRWGFRVPLALMRTCRLARVITLQEWGRFVGGISFPVAVSKALLSRQLGFKRPFPPTSAPTSHVTTRQFRHDSSQSPSSQPSNFAFAFDIDGVLLRSSAPLPGATSTLRFLHRHSIPFILLTNGGGRTESSRVSQLSTLLNVPITSSQFIQSHTPFKSLVPELKDKTILVTGNDQERVREVAMGYGFNNVVTPGDIWAKHPNIWPFSHLLKDYYTKHAQPLPAEPLKIDAMFVFSDPHDWALDTQLFLDLLLSENGVVGTLSSKNGDPELPNRGWYQDGQPKLIFSNPDMFWASSYPQSRLGQGGFRAALRGVWDEVTDGAELPKLVIGKPTRTTYEYAEKMLDSYRQKMLTGTSPLGEEPVGPLKRVFMVGDNPESDLRGANEFDSPRGIEWHSLLVKTGVWRDVREPKYKPKAIVEDIREAVKYGLRKQGYVFDESELLD